MKKKLSKGNWTEEVLNINLLNLKLPNLKPPTFTIFENRLKKRQPLKDKVTSVIYKHLKTNQSNQNFLNPLQELSFATNNNDLQKKNRKAIYLNTKYDVVSAVSCQIGFKIVNENEDWDIMWIDGSVSSIKAFQLKRHQKVNHFPGMHEISRKDKLQRNLKIMQRYFFSEYNIFPKTWNLPHEKGEVTNFIREKQNGDNDTFIIKPACSSQGRGIILINDVNSLSVNGNTICQVYIPNPFLIDGYKFDLRMYVLITSCDPLRMFVYNEGLARFATCLYEKPNPNNIDNIYMHLTNYSLQRNSEKFDKDEIYGTKRRATTIYEWFNSHGYDADAIWKSIDDVLVKTMLCANNTIKHYYSATFPDKYRTSACFELLGFDIILDDHLKPYVLEVNHSPSLETETSLDLVIKTQLLKDIFCLVNSIPVNSRKLNDLEHLRSAERLYWSRNQFMSSRKASIEFRNVLSEMQLELEKCEMKNKNGFRVLFPIIGQTEKYQKFFEFNCEEHRTPTWKYGSSDEPEHKLIIGTKKDLMAQLAKPSKISRHDRNRLLNNDPRNYLRLLNHNKPINTERYHGTREKLTKRLKDTLNNDKIPNTFISGLLASSKKSLQQIMLSNIPDNSLKINIDDPENSIKFNIDDPENSIKFNIDDPSNSENLEAMKTSYYGSNGTSTIPQNGSEVVSQISIEEIFIKSDNSKPSNVSESNQHEKISNDRNWETSVSPFKLRKIEKCIVDLEKNISTKSRSFINMHEMNTPVLKVCTSTNLLQKDNTYPCMVYTNFECTENILCLRNYPGNAKDSDIQYQTEEPIDTSLLREIVCLQSPTKFPHYLPSIKTQPDLIMNSIITEKDPENIYSTSLNISSVNVTLPMFEINCNNQESVVSYILNSEISTNFFENCEQTTILTEDRILKHSKINEIPKIPSHINLFEVAEFFNVFSSSKQFRGLIENSNLLNLGFCLDTKNMMYVNKKSNNGVYDICNYDPIYNINEIQHKINRQVHPGKESIVYQNYNFCISKLMELNKSNNACKLYKEVNQVEYIDNFEAVTYLSKSKNYTTSNIEINLDDLLNINNNNSKLKQDIKHFSGSILNVHKNDICENQSKNVLYKHKKHKKPSLKDNISSVKSNYKKLKIIEIKNVKTSHKIVASNGCETTFIINNPRKEKKGLRYAEETIYSISEVIEDRNYINNDYNYQNPFGNYRTTYPVNIYNQIKNENDDTLIENELMTLDSSMDTTYVIENPLENNPLIKNINTRSFQRPGDICYPSPQQNLNVTYINNNDTKLYKTNVSLESQINEINKLKYEIPHRKEVEVLKYKTDNQNNKDRKYSSHIYFNKNCEWNAHEISSTNLQNPSTFMKNHNKFDYKERLRNILVKSNKMESTFYNLGLSTLNLS